MNKTLAAMHKENVTITDEPFKFDGKTTIAFIEDLDGPLTEVIERKKAKTKCSQKKKRLLTTKRTLFSFSALGAHSSKS